MLWINLQVTKKVNQFNYARLEESVFYQYSYGSSKDLLKQASQFLSGFVKLKPFTAGNRASAFVGVVTFLQVNGMKFNVAPDSVAPWFVKASQGDVDAVRQAFVQNDEHHHEAAPDIEAVAGQVLEDYGQAVAELVANANS